MCGVINSGHERQLAFVIRVINDRATYGQFTTWCPKTIARIGQPKPTISEPLDSDSARTQGEGD